MTEIQMVDENELNILIKSMGDVYLTLLPGYKENIYQQALSTEFTLHNTPHSLEVVVPILYKGYYVGFERADIVLYAGQNPSAVIELKAQGVSLGKKEFNQLSKYIHNLNLSVGYVVNFLNTTNKITEDNVLEYLEICKIQDGVLYKFHSCSMNFQVYNYDFNIHY